MLCSWAPLLMHTDACETAACHSVVAADVDRYHLAQVMWCHQLMDLTAGQLRKGICLWTWRPQCVCMEGSRKPAWGGWWVCHTQTDGRPEDENLISTSSLTIWKATHSPGNFPKSQICKGRGGVRSRRFLPLKASVQGQRTVCWASQALRYSVHLKRRCYRQGSAREVLGIIKLHSWKDLCDHQLIWARDEAPSKATQLGVLILRCLCSKQRSFPSSHR